MKARNFIPFDYREARMKYKNILQTVDGITFHSKLEARYYQMLKMEKKTGLIRDFERQVAFDLYAWTKYALNENLAKAKVCVHIVDFLVTMPDGSYEVRETKGFATDVWDLKRKMFEKNYPEIPYKVIRRA